MSFDLAHHDRQIKHAMSRIRVCLATKNYAGVAAWAKGVEDHAKAADRLLAAADEVKQS